jgi:acetyltransferase-like isoleucine patch superfamily enzyme
VKSKLIKAAIASAMPGGALRRLAYRLLLGYRIDPTASIGMFTVIAVPRCEIGPRVRIGPFNLFKGAMTIRIGANSRIGRHNEFTANWKLGDPRFAHMNYTPELDIGEGCLVLHSHYFDVYGKMVLGDGSWVAGIRSQFWTHGVSVMDRDIVIGRNNYIGSGARFAPGSGIGDGNVVGMGAVVTSRIEADNSVISGFPAKALRSIEAEKAAGKYRFSFEDWVN